MPQLSRVTALAALALLGAASAKTYSNSKLGLSFSYPSNWTSQEGVAGTVVFVAAPPRGGFPANLNVVAQPTNQAVTLDLLYTTTVNSFKNLITEYKQTSTRNVRISGVNGREISFTGRQGKNRLQWRQTMFIKSNTAYAITYTRLAKDTSSDRDAQAVVQSLKVR